MIQRIAELRREGLWSTRRLPKVQEPARSKAHWDYLLEEMQWLAADFAQERKWKKAGARKVCDVQCPWKMLPQLLLSGPAKSGSCKPAVLYILSDPR